MCGRYSIAIEPTEIEERFDAQFSVGVLGQAPRYNAAPSQALPVILNSSPSSIVLSHWGIAPPWLSRVSSRGELINVRVETLRDRPTFRDDLVSRRCLVLADGFYEWMADAERRRKVPFRITREDRAPFAFAGIWQEGASGSSPRFAIITTAADSFMRPIHSRMPVILDREEEREWISPARMPQGLPALTMSVEE